MSERDRTGVSKQMFRGFTQLSIIIDYSKSLTTRKGSIERWILLTFYYEGRMFRVNLIMLRYNGIEATNLRGQFFPFYYLKAYN